MTDIIILFCTSIGGLLVGKTYENVSIKKEKLYLDLYEFAVKFSVNAGSNRVVLSQFVAQFISSSGAEFAACCNTYLLNKAGGIRFLTKKETQYIRRFFDGLNAANSQVLQEHLKFYTAYFDDALKQSRLDNNTKGKIGQKLGLLCGVIIGLVLI